MFVVGITGGLDLWGNNNGKHLLLDYWRCGVDLWRHDNDLDFGSAEHAGEDCSDCGCAYPAWLLYLLRTGSGVGSYVGYQR